VDGRDATRDDVKPGTEQFLVAGDQVHATFGFARGLRATWHSVKRGDHWNTPFQKPREKWGFELHGTKRILAYQEGLGFVFLDSPFPGHREPRLEWQPLPESAARQTPLHERHPIHSLIHAVETGAEPLCSGRDGAWAVEMVAAVYQSHFSRKRVDFPLADRGMGWGG
jgi:predicted dehydrogenase